MRESGDLRGFKDLRGFGDLRGFEDQIGFEDQTEFEDLKEFEDLTVCEDQRGLHKFLESDPPKENYQVLIKMKIVLIYIEFI